MVPAVLTWLASCGNILVRHVPNSPKANWLHLRFNNPAEARRALGRHGSLLGMDTMIAVTPCADTVRIFFTFLDQLTFELFKWKILAYHPWMEAEEWYYSRGRQQQFFRGRRHFYLFDDLGGRQQFDVRQSTQLQPQISSCQPRYFGKSIMH